MSVQKKQIEMYQLKIVKYEVKNVPVQEISIKEELEKILNYAMSLPEIERKKDFQKDNKILFIHSYTFDETNNIYNIVMASAKYNHVRNVINTDTFENRGLLKHKEDGDVEYNYLSIRCINQSIALTAFANNYYGVRLAKVLKYLDDIADKYYKEVVDARKFYNFGYDIIVEQDFLRELTKMNRISAIKVTVTKELISNSEFVEVANIDEIKDEVEIAFKASKGKSLGLGTAKGFYNKRLNSPDIKRIVVDGKLDGVNVCLDTEKLKQKHNIEIEQKIDGSLDAKEIFNKLIVFLGVESYE